MCKGWSVMLSLGASSIGDQDVGLDGPLVYPNVAILNQTQLAQKRNPRQDGSKSQTRGLLEETNCGLTKWPALSQ